MWELDYKESWAQKNWCFWTVVLEKTLESPLYCKEIQPVHLKGDQSWVFIGGTDAEAETPILWPPDVESWLIWKDPDAGKDWGQGEKGTTEDEMVGWHHQLNGHGFGRTPGVGDGQEGLACCGSWGHKGSDTTEWLNWTELEISGTTGEVPSEEQEIEGQDRDGDRLGADSSSSGDSMQSEERKRPGLGRVMSGMCCLGKGSSGEHKGGRVASSQIWKWSGEYPVSLPSYPSVGQAFRTKAHVIHRSNTSSFNYEHYIQFQNNCIFSNLHIKNAPKPFFYQLQISL